MKKRFSLFNDTDNEPISIGLARLVKFLQYNRQNQKCKKN